MSTSNLSTPRLSVPLSTPTSSSNRARIAEYYAQMDASYRHWGNSGAYELHYGFFDQPTVIEGGGELERQSHLRALVRMNEVMAEAAGAQPTDRVLDAGCGVGASSLWLAEHIGCKVHGISLSKHQIHIAQSLRRQRPHAACLVDFSVQDFTATSFTHSSFDVIWGIESICYAEDKAAFVAEAVRLLRPGGRLAVADYFLTPGEPSEVAAYSLDRWLGGWVIPNLCSLTGFKDFCRQSGLEELENRDITDHIRPSAEEIFRRGKHGYPDDVLTQGKNVLQIRHVEACLFQKICLDLDLWRYRILVWQKPLE